MTSHQVSKCKLSQFNLCSCPNCTFSDCFELKHRIRDGCSCEQICKHSEQHISCLKQIYNASDIQDDVIRSQSSDRFETKHEYKIRKHYKVIYKNILNKKTAQNTTVVPVEKTDQKQDLPSKECDNPDFKLPKLESIPQLDSDAYINNKNIKTLEGRTDVKKDSAKNNNNNKYNPMDVNESKKFLLDDDREVLLMEKCKLNNAELHSYHVSSLEEKSPIALTNKKSDLSPINNSCNVDTPKEKNKALCDDKPNNKNNNDILEQRTNDLTENKHYFCEKKDFVSETCKKCKVIPCNMHSNQLKNESLESKTQERPRQPDSPKNDKTYAAEKNTEYINNTIKRRCDKTLSEEETKNTASTTFVRPIDVNKRGKLLLNKNGKLYCDNIHDMYANISEEKSQNFYARESIDIRGKKSNTSLTHSYKLHVHKSFKLEETRKGTLENKSDCLQDNMTFHKLQSATDCNPKACVIVILDNHEIGTIESDIIQPSHKTNKCTARKQWPKTTAYKKNCPVYSNKDSMECVSSTKSKHSNTKMSIECHQSLETKTHKGDFNKILTERPQQPNSPKRDEICADRKNIEQLDKITNRKSDEVLSKEETKDKAALICPMNKHEKHFLDGREKSYNTDIHENILNISDETSQQSPNPEETTKDEDKLDFQSQKKRYSKACVILDNHTIGTTRSVHRNNAHVNLTKPEPNILTWIKDYIHKDIEDIRNTLKSIMNYDKAKEDSDVSISLDSKQKPIFKANSCVSEKVSLAFYDKIKYFFYNNDDSFIEPNNKLISIKSIVNNENESEKIALAEHEDLTTITILNSSNISQKTKGNITIEDQQSHHRSITIPTNENKLLNITKSANFSFTEQHELVLRSQEDLWKGQEIKNEEDPKSVFRESLTDTFNACATSIGELRAEVMNVPYKQYKKSIICPETNLKRSNDLLKKIHRIYKACSCKVCECIGSSPTVIQGETCNCKSCNCFECRSRKVTKNNSICKAQLNHDVKTLQTESKTCQCMPCSCIKCKKDYYPQSCNCKRCECLDCKSFGMYMQTNFIVAPVEETHERPYCQCSPCGCFECAHPFGTSPPNFYTQATSTDGRRHMNCHCNNCDNENCEQEGTDTCNCDKHAKLMRKPVNNNKNEYDIHYLRTENLHFKRFENNKKQSQTVTHHQYPHHRYHTTAENTNSDIKIANSNCTSSIFSRGISFSMIPQDYWALRAKLLMPDSYECNCEPCECQKCKKHFLEGHIPYRRGMCSCEICDCLNCATLSVLYKIDKKYNRKVNWSESIEKCSCKPCTCKLCTKYDTVKSLRIDDAIVDRGTLVYQSRNFSNFPKLLRTFNTEYFIDQILSDKETINKSNHTKKYNSICDTANLKLCCANYSREDKYLKPKKISKADKDYSGYKANLKQRESYSYYRNKNEKNLPNINSAFLSRTESYRCIRKKPKQQESIMESSCNSSGHDYSDYLIRFPTSTVKTCIYDVMSSQIYYDKTGKTYSQISLTTKADKYYSDSLMNALKNDKYSSNNTTLTSDYTDTCNHTKRPNKWPNTKRCLCDCTNCGCSTNCLSENRSVLERINETTQTSKSVPNCGEEMYKLPLLSKNTNATFRENDRIVRWTDYSINHFPRNTRNEFVTYNLPKINYDSVQRTLREAKQFSAELLIILQKYKKANKDFDSMAERFKRLKESTLIENDTQNQEQTNHYEKAYNNTTSKYQNILNKYSNATDECDKVFGEDCIVINMPSCILNKYDQICKVENESSCASKTATKMSEIFESSFPIENDLKENMDQVTNESTAVINKIDTQLIIKEQIKPNKVNNSKGKHIKAQEDTSNSTKTSTLQFKSNLEKLKNEYKDYSQRIDKVIDKIRQKERRNETSACNSGSHVPKNTIIENKSPASTPKFSDAIQGQRKGFKITTDNENLNTVYICHSQKEHEHHLHNEMSILNPKQLDSLKQFILPEERENVTANSKVQDTKLQPTTRDVQFQAQMFETQIIQSMPSMDNKMVEFNQNGTKSAVKMHSIKVRPEQSDGSCSDPMKVVIQMVKYVSDHSILLKWKLPEKLTNVLGYQVLVEGRPVHRILNPQKNLAVLTCLPHTDKIRLSVCTITKTTDGHNPCASIAYCCRNRP